MKPHPTCDTEGGNRFWTQEARGYPRAYFKRGEACDAEHLFVCLVAPMRPLQPPPNGPGLHEAYLGGVVDDEATVLACLGFAAEAGKYAAGLADSADWCLVPAEDAEKARLALATRSIAPLAVIRGDVWQQAERNFAAGFDGNKSVPAGGLVERLLHKKAFGVMLAGGGGLRTVWLRASSLGAALAAGRREMRDGETLAGVVPAEALRAIGAALDNTLAGGWCVQCRIIDGYSEGMDEYKAWLLIVTASEGEASPEAKVDGFFEQAAEHGPLGSIPATPAPTTDERAALVRNAEMVQALIAEGVCPGI